MKLTRNLKIYVIFNILVTGLIYYLTVLKDVGVQKVENSDGTTTITTSMPFLWLLILGLSFLVLYKTDSRRDSRANLSFAYHVATICIVLIPVVSMLIAIPFTSIELDAYLIVPPLVLMVSLFIHWFFTRKDPKGIEAKKVFK